MSRNQRIALAVAAAAVAVLAFAIAQPGDDEDDGERSASTPAQTDTERRDRRHGRRRHQAPDGDPGGAAAPARAEVYPHPDARRRGRRRSADIEVARGDTVRIVVTSDAPDEIHLHGYDITRNAAPGRPARFQFKADAEGAFEIESHVAEDAGRNRSSPTWLSTLVTFIAHGLVARSDLRSRSGCSAGPPRWCRSRSSLSRSCGPSRGCERGRWRPLPRGIGRCSQAGPWRSLRGDRRLPAGRGGLRRAARRPEPHGELRADLHLRDLLARLVPLSVLFGDVFNAFNPWRAIGRGVGWVAGKAARGDLPAPLAYPERLGDWPAVAGILAFAASSSWPRTATVPRTSPSRRSCTRR